jgi:hypothetical protein
MFIPGWLLQLATFPGVVVHELSHELFCRLFGVRVVKVCYFRFGSPAGYVVHETPREVSHHIWISVGPFIVNTTAGALVALPATVPMPFLHLHRPWNYVLAWLGVSIAMHAFPSTGDAKSIWRGLWSKRAPILARLAGVPIVLVIYLGALGSFFWLDIAYGVGVALFLPRAILKLLA